MEKEEYVYKLRSELVNYPESFRNEVLDSFEAHYAKGVVQGKKVSMILEEFGDPETLHERLDALYHDQPDRKKIDALWVSKSRKFVQDVTDYKMGASILIPLLFVLMIILHYFGII